MARQSKKPTVAQLTERIEHLELAMGEMQQFMNLIANSARNDIMRHDDILKSLCESTGVEFVDHPLPTDEKVDESIGESD
tara:strand:+ start:3941 stop:4180 length:240 start_codon:yes stop_codon:yes gene_type:complete